MPPWLEPFERWFAGTDPRGNGVLDLDRLSTLARERAITLESGLPLRFVDAAEGRGLVYESFVFETGCVPTRSSGPGMLHDWFNALCWLRWPAIKARLNRLQADAIRASEPGGGRDAAGERDALSGCDTVGGRGPLRDAVTGFDESGALFVVARADDPAIARWRRFDWHALFVGGRAGFRRDVRVLLVGHALLEKLVDPYKAICAQALPVVARAHEPPTGPGWKPGRDPLAPADLDRPDDLDRLDRQVAATIEPGNFVRDRLAPLPLLGVPGWWPANEDPGFYNDRDVFRQGRQRRTRQ